MIQKIKEKIKKMTQCKTKKLKKKEKMTIHLFFYSLHYFTFLQIFFVNIKSISLFQKYI